MVVCGRRWGKTDVGLHATVQGHGPLRGSLKGAIDGGEVWWIAPTNKVAAKVWRMLKRSLHAVWKNKSEQEKRIEVPGGGAVTIKSAERPDDLRGEGLDGVVIDEAAFISESIWKNVVRPALTDKRGWCMFITSPNGKNWLHKLFERADNRRGWSRWQLPTSDNPRISEAELTEAMIELGPQSFGQEHLAQFLAIEGATFQGDWFGDSIWFDQWPSRDQITARVAYCDPSLGKTDKSDYSAIVLAEVDFEGNVWLDASIERRSTTKIAQDVVAVSRAFQPQVFGIESNGFQELLADQIGHEASRQGIPLPLREVVNTMAKVTRIRSLTPYLYRGNLRFKKGSAGAQLLVEQLQGFPISKHDDGPDALAGAIAEAHSLLFGAVETDDDAPIVSRSLRA